MNNIIFNGPFHSAFYYEFVRQLNACSDCYRKAFIYCMGIHSYTRRKFGTYYDVKENHILIPAYPHTVGGEGQNELPRNIFKTLVLAYNLYNGMDIVDKPTFSPAEFFATEEAPFYIQAIELRHERYFTTHSINKK